MNEQFIHKNTMDLKGIMLSAESQLQKVTNGISLIKPSSNDKIIGMENGLVVDRC